MKIQLIAVGTKMPKWVEEGFTEYRRRFPHDMHTRARRNSSRKKREKCRYCENFAKKEERQCFQQCQKEIELLLSTFPAKVGYAAIVPATRVLETRRKGCFNIDWWP